MIAKSEPPKENGANGRDEKGRFVEGNRGGPGNPNAIKVAKLREALLAAVTAKDLREVVKALIREAKKGDVAAARELLDRTIGKVTNTIGVDDRLENLITQIQVIEDEGWYGNDAHSLARAQEPKL